MDPKGKHGNHRAAGKTEALHKELDLLTGADEAFFPGLLVSVLSALKSLSPDCPCRVTVIDGGLSRKSIDFLHERFDLIAANRVASAELSICTVDLTCFENLPKIYGRSAMTYARLIAPSLIEADEVIWIDSDMIFFTDLSEAVRIPDKEKYLLAGAPDQNITSMEQDCPFEPQGDYDPTYINCGLLWMNLRVMRSTQFSTMISKKMMEWKESLTYWDQTALNAVTPHAKYLLPAHLNEHTHNRPEKEIIDLVGKGNLHMILKNKPWLTPTAFGAAARDLVFFKTYAFLTGEACQDKFQTIRKSVRKNTAQAAYKCVFYTLTGNRKRYAKWKKAIIRARDLQQWEDEIDRRLASWHEAHPSALPGS